MKNWYRIECFPTKFEYEIINQQINKRYVLNNSALESVLPKVIPEEEVPSSGVDVNTISTLYTFTYDIDPLHRIELSDSDIEIIKICEISNFTEIENCKFPVSARADLVVTNDDIDHQLIDKIVFPEISLGLRSAKFTSKQVYQITRQFIIDHIDQANAKITSNYEFCFAVSKTIPYRVPKEITFQNLFAKTQKERNKIQTRISTYKEFLIFR